LNITILSVLGAIIETLNMSSSDVWHYDTANYPLVRLLMSSDDKIFPIFNFAAPKGFSHTHLNSTQYADFLVEELSQAISSGRINDIFHKFLVNHAQKVSNKTPSIVSVAVKRFLPSRSPSHHPTTVPDSQSDNATVVQLIIIIIGSFCILCVGAGVVYYCQVESREEKNLYSKGYINLFMYAPN
jgi:hypothetical protein